VRRIIVLAMEALVEVDGHIADSGGLAIGLGLLLTLLRHII
jgi:hypothetical protein